MKVDLRNFVILIILFLTVYFPPFKFLLISPEYLLIILCLAWATANLKKIYKAISTKQILIFFSIQILIIIYAFFIDKFFRNNYNIPLDRLYYFKQLRFLANSFFISLVISAYLNYNKWSVDRLLNAYIKIGVVQAFISTLMLISPGIKNFVINMLNVDFLYEEKGELLLFRLYGVSSEYLFTYPIFQGFVLMIIFMKVIMKEYKYLIYVPFVLISIVFNARIGLFAIPVIFIVYLIYILKQKNKLPLLYKYLKISLAAIVFIIAVVAISVHIVGIEVFELVLLRGILSNPNGINHFGNLFGRMVFFPSSFFGFIFGEGRYVYQNSNELHSDVGYIIDLLFGGIIYILLYIGNLGKLMFTKVRSGNVTYYILVIASFVLLLICNYKGPILANNGYLRALLILVFLHLLNQKNESKTLSINSYSII